MAGPWRRKRTKTAIDETTDSRNITLTLSSNVHYFDIYSRSEKSEQFHVLDFLHSYSKTNFSKKPEKQ